MEQSSISRHDLVQLDEFTYEIPRSYRSDMRVPARFFASPEILEAVLHDRSLEQLVNVATLPGIQQWALAMPDMHQGYGFPIGGVAAMDIKKGGVISPGGIGYDINCGVRLLATSLTYGEIKPHLEKLATAIYHSVPSGVGRAGKLNLSDAELDRILELGAAYLVGQGYGTQQDLELCEEGGHMKNARAETISELAKKRGADQLGTLGSGNHFLEIQRVEQIFDERVARVFGIAKDQVVVMIHCGSRGLGHQTCTDYVRAMMPHFAELGIQVPDRELACVPFKHTLGGDYFDAMAAAANFGWANRHMIGHQVRQVFTAMFGESAEVRTVYDVSHNMGKLEKHLIDGVETELLVHRKGATRSFGPSRPEVPSAYRPVGQPVLIPGTMGTASYILVGNDAGLAKSFGTSCHGAGRSMSRTKAKGMVQGRQLRDELEKQGIIIRCDSNAGLAEEAPIAYKDVDNVVNVVQGAGLATKVARCVPLAVIKGG